MRQVRVVPEVEGLNKLPYFVQSMNVEGRVCVVAEVEGDGQK
jgi:hypothetical protein